MLDIQNTEIGGENAISIPANQGRKTRENINTLLYIPHIQNTDILLKRLGYIISFLQNGKPEIAEKLYYVFKKDIIIGFVLGKLRYDNSDGIQDNINEVYYNIFGKRFDNSIDTLWVHFCIRPLQRISINELTYLYHLNPREFCKRIDKFF